MSSSAPLSRHGTESALENRQGVAPCAAKKPAKPSISTILPAKQTPAAPSQLKASRLKPSRLIRTKAKGIAPRRAGTTKPPASTWNRGEAKRRPKRRKPPSRESVERRPPRSFEEPKRQERNPASSTMILASSLQRCRSRSLSREPRFMEATMNKDQASPEGKPMQARVWSKWAKLTDDVLRNLAAEKDSYV